MSFLDTLISITPRFMHPRPKTAEEQREADLAAGLDQTAQIEAAKRAEALRREREALAIADQEANPPPVASMKCPELAEELKVLTSRVSSADLDPARISRMNSRLAQLGQAISSNCSAEVAAQNLARAVTDLNAAIASRDPAKITAAQARVATAAEQLPKPINRLHIIIGLLSLGAIVGLWLKYRPR